jgi:hypothetical protein
MKIGGQEIDGNALTSRDNKATKEGDGKIDVN